MKYTILIYIVSFFLSIISSTAQEIDTANFPEAYFGKYIGTLQISSTKGPKTFPMEFHLLPRDSVGSYTYTLVYGEGEQRQERLYTLVSKDPDNGEYIIDENNGIVLNAKILGNRMYCLFEVQGTILTTFITFEEGHLVFEIAASNRENKNISGGQNEASPEVISYPITTVQRAELIKQ